MNTWWDPDSTLDAIAGAIATVDWGDHVKDNLKYLFNPPQARVYNAAQSVAAATVVALTHNSERYDTDALHSTVTNTSRLTCVRAGVHHLGGRAAVSGSAGGGQRSLFLRLNGATTIDQIDLPRNGAAVTQVTLSTDYKLALSDYVELCAFHDAGVALDYTPEFYMRWAGLGT